MPGCSRKTKVTNSALPSSPLSKGVSTTDESAVTPVKVIRTPVVLKPRKVRLATQSVDATTHDEPLALRHSKRKTAGRKLDSILKAEKEPLPQPEPKPAGTELDEDNGNGRNADGIEDIQNTKRINQSCSSPPTFPVTAVAVRKANILVPPNQTSRAKLRTMVGIGFSVTPVISGHIWSATICLRELPKL